MNDENAPPDEKQTELPAIDFQSPGRFSVHNPTSIRSILEQREPAPFRLGEHQPLQRFTSADTRAATSADFGWVQDLGIAGFPTLLAERNGQLALLTNGYQSLEALAPLLARWLEQAAHA